MTRPGARLLAALSLALAYPLLLAACGGGTDDGPTGRVSVALAPGARGENDNVWVTVRAAWFHQSAEAPWDAKAPGWRRFSIDGGTTVNLAAPGGGALLPLADDLALPEGTYRQVAVVLASTEDPLEEAAAAAGLLANNQVDRGARRAPLRVPNADQGIRAFGTFRVSAGSVRRIALVLEPWRDVLPFDRGAAAEFLFKPLAEAVDLDGAGAVAGTLDRAAAADGAALFVVAAERAAAGADARRVLATSSVDPATGRFVLYPVPADTGRCDVVVRGTGYDEAVVHRVPVAAGTAPAASPTDLGPPLAMRAALLPGYRVGGTARPTGAAVRFYRRLPNEAALYEVATVQADPFSGRYGAPPLSVSPLWVGTYDGRGSDNAIRLTPIVPLDLSGNPDNGAYALRATAPFCLPGPAGFLPVTPAFAGTDLPLIALAAAFPPSGIGNVAAGTVGIPGAAGRLDNLVVFATLGGLVVNADVLGNPPPGPTRSSYAIADLAGGTAAAPWRPAVYGISAYGWTGASGTLWVGRPENLLADLSRGDGAADLVTLAPAP